MDQKKEREQVVSSLLRQLWFGLAIYRLYPGTSERVGFQATAGLIQEAARSALESGPIDVEVTADGFSVTGLDLPADRPLQRLARVCFERRAERLQVTGVPTATELEAVFEVLTMPVEHLDQAGGMENLLHDVHAVALGRLGPIQSQPFAEGGDRGPVAFDQEGSPIDMDSPLLVDGLQGPLTEQVEAILDRLRSVIEQLGAQGVHGVDLYQTLSDSFVDLSAELRRAVMARLIEDAADDPLAERLIGSMSNSELTRALVELGKDGREPIGLAHQLTESGVRSADIVDFTEALEAGYEEASTILAGLERIGSPTEGLDPGGTVSDALAAYLIATEQEDLRSMKWLAESAEEQSSSVALATLQDYLGVERDQLQFDQVAGVWVDAIRDAVRNREFRRVIELLSAVDGIKMHAEDKPFFDVYGPQVLDRKVVRQLMLLEGEADGPGAASVLSSFGDVGVEALFEQLAEEEDRGRRAGLLGVLRQLAPGRAKTVVPRLSDPRWYVVRNAVNVLRHTGDPDVLELLAGASKHTAEAVRREAVWGLAAGGVAAVPYLAQLANAPDRGVRRLSVQALGGLTAPEAVGALTTIVISGSETETRRQALDALAEHNSSESRDALRSLAGRVRPRLPRALRKHAKSLGKSTKPERHK
jgi:HEAT repeats